MGAAGRTDAHKQCVKENKERRGAKNMNQESRSKWRYEQGKRVCVRRKWFNSPLERKYPFEAVAELTSLCSLTSGYHSAGGEDAVFPKDFHPLP